MSNRLHETLVNFLAGDTIIQEGDVCDDIYCIIDGNVEIIKKNTNREEVVLAVLGPGDVFGELGQILGLHRLASVIATTNVTAEIIKPTVFDEILNTPAGERLRPIINSMAERIRIHGIRLTELETRTKKPDTGERDEERVVMFVADTAEAIATMDGVDNLQVTKFPFRVGRFAPGRGEGLFYRNDLNLLQEMPFTVSRTQFSIVRNYDEYFLVDRSSEMGNVVNGVTVGGLDEHTERRIKLSLGDNIVYIGKPHYNLRYRIIIQ